MRTTAVPLTAWRAIFGFGLVSLAADMVYEGARSITGPLLAVAQLVSAVLLAVTLRLPQAGDSGDAAPSGGR
ncbi:MAG TPA: hypothetical protein VN408_29715 [Actinoplanes sp.]|nr:hypothetical protein [Actinoplanes sp.]